MVTIQVWSQGRSCHFLDIDNNTRSNTNRMSQHFLLFSFIECSSFSNSSYNWLAQCLLVLFFSLLCQLFLLFVVIEDGWHVLSWVACCGVMVVPKHLEHFTIWRYCGIILYVNCLSMVPSVTAQQKTTILIFISPTCNTPHPRYQITTMFKILTGSNKLVHSSCRLWSRLECG